MYMVLMKLGSGDCHKLLQSYQKYKTRKILLHQNNPFSTVSDRRYMGAY